MLEIEKESQILLSGVYKKIEETLKKAEKY